MAFGSGSSFSTDCSTRRSGSPASPKLCKFGCLTLLHQHSSSKPSTQSTLSSARCISQSLAKLAFFSFVEGVGRGNPVLGSLPADPHPRKRRSDSLPANALLCESLLKTHLRGHLHRPQAAWLAELPGVPVKHLAQSLGPLLVEDRLTVCGRLEPLRSASWRPSWLTLWMALRAVCGLQPRLWAI